METQKLNAGKKKFIEAWTNQVNSLYGMWPSTEQYPEFKGHIDALLAMIPNIAETKTSFREN